MILPRRMKARTFTYVCHLFVPFLHNCWIRQCVVWGSWSKHDFLNRILAQHVWPWDPSSKQPKHNLSQNAFSRKLNQGSCKLWQCLDIRQSLAFKGGQAVIQNMCIVAFFSAIMTSLWNKTERLWNWCLCLMLEWWNEWHCQQNGPLVDCASHHTSEH